MNKWMIWGYHYFWKHPCSHDFFLGGSVLEVRFLFIGFWHVFFLKGALGWFENYIVVGKGGNLSSSNWYLGGVFTYFLFSPRNLGKVTILTSIFFQRGWFNYRLGMFHSHGQAMFGAKSLQMRIFHNFSKGWWCQRFGKKPWCFFWDMMFIEF